MLEVFLLANLLTGAVNLAMDTRAAGSALAVTILVAYSAVLCWAGLLLQRRGVRLRWPQSTE
jgi:hypothetical protein